MKIDGRCHCGFITYEAEVDPDEVFICSCTDCQAISGTAFRWAVPVPEGSFKLLTGKPKTYIKTADSGKKRIQAFCPNCGTPIYSVDAHERRAFGIRVGTLKQRAELRPMQQIWYRSALPWVADIRGVPHVETQ